MTEVIAGGVVSYNKIRIRAYTGLGFVFLWAKEKKDLGLTYPFGFRGGGDHILVILYMHIYGRQGRLIWCAPQSNLPLSTFMPQSNSLVEAFFLF
jgi:hypothetical protein